MGHVCDFLQKAENHERIRGQGFGLWCLRNQATQITMSREKVFWGEGKSCFQLGFSDLKGFDFWITLVYAVCSVACLIWNYNSEAGDGRYSEVSSSSLATFLVIFGTSGGMPCYSMLLFPLILFQVSEWEISERFHKWNFV